METVSLIDVRGRRFEAELLASEDGRRLLRLQGGQKVWLPDDVLVKHRNGDYSVDASFEDLEAAADAAGSRQSGEDEYVLPLVEERASIRKRRRETGRVRITKRVTQREEHLEDLLTADRVEVTRVPVHQEVDAPTPVRHEGNTTIIPLFEEVLVIEKRLVLTEEVHVTVEQTERLAEHTVTLRREEAITERLEPDGADEDTEGGA